MLYYVYEKQRNSQNAIQGVVRMHTFLEKCGNYEPKIPNILYHYCSVDTMLKIVQNYCIWLSDAEKTNDKSELKYFTEQRGKMTLNILESYKGEINDQGLSLVKVV